MMPTRVKIPEGLPPPIIPPSTPTPPPTTTTEPTPSPSESPSTTSTTSTSTSPPPSTTTTTTTTPTTNNLPLDSTQTVARLSEPWSSDDTHTHCGNCSKDFHNLNRRRHHCRLCGRIFCGDCSSQRALIPPSSIVLTPKGGKKVKSQDRDAGGVVTFEPDDDPDRMVTYMKSPEMVQTDQEYVDDEEYPSPDGLKNGQSSSDTILYGKGLEERYKLSREPLRVCDACYERLQSVQEELRACNSNAVRYNAIDPTDVRRLFNSPLAFTLGHEIRKAAYTLNNLLPLPKKLGAFVSSSAFSQESSGAYSMYNGTAYDPTAEQCRDTCKDLSNNVSKLDGVRIPARLLEQAKGVAVLTVVKGGFGLAGFEFGTGLVVARLSDDRGWSAPSAIGTAGVSWGALVGAQVTDHVFLLMSDTAVDLMSSDDGSLQLGADIGVAIGPLGRTVEADVGATGNSGSGGVAVSPIYTYSLSKGLYAGVSLDGKAIMTRHRVNEKFYGQSIHPRDLLGGEIPTPPAAQPLYDALKRCHVYASGASSASIGTSGRVGMGNDRYNEAAFGDQQPYGAPPPPAAGTAAADVVGMLDGAESTWNAQESLAQIPPPTEGQQANFVGDTGATSGPL